jgi:hypothetical protein
MKLFLCLMESKIQQVKKDFNVIIFLIETLKALFVSQSSIFDSIRHRNTFMTLFAF